MQRRFAVFELDYFCGRGGQQGDDDVLNGRLDMKMTNIFINFYTKPDEIPLGNNYLEKCGFS